MWGMKMSIIMRSNRPFSRARNPAFSSFGDRYLEIIPLEIDLDGHAHHRIVVDNENMVQISRPV